MLKGASSMVPLTSFTFLLLRDRTTNTGRRRFSKIFSQNFISRSMGRKSFSMKYFFVKFHGMPLVKEIRYRIDQRSREGNIFRRNIFDQRSREGNIFRRNIFDQRSREGNIFPRNIFSQKSTACLLSREFGTELINDHGEEIFFDEIF